MAYIRKYKTASGAIAVQVCYKKGRKVAKVVHVGSAATDYSLEKLLRRAQGIIDMEKKSLFDLKKFDEENKKD